MYTIQKSEAFSDDLELKDAAGKNLILNIRLNITPQLAGQYRALQVRLLNLQKQAADKPGDPETIEQIGRAVSDVLALLFGTENLEKMAEFYEGDFLTMLSDVFPYIQEVIAPRFADLAKSRKAQLKRRFR